MNWTMDRNCEFTIDGTTGTLISNFIQPTEITLGSSSTRVTFENADPIVNQLLNGDINFDEAVNKVCKNLEYKKENNDNKYKVVLGDECSL